MSGKNETDREDSEESYGGCLAALAAFVILFGIACAAGGYFLYARLARVDEVVGKAGTDEAATPNPPQAASTSDATQSSAQKSSNSLRQIMLAMHNHQDNSRSFPPPSSASYDAQGRPLLSWRVYLLPFVDQAPLYEMFHLDEPWDSAHNRTLLDKMPDVYLSRGVPSDGNRTGFVLFQSQEMYHIARRGPDLWRNSDGTSQTLFVVEAGPELAVPWTRPEDLSFDPAQPLAALGELPKDGFWGGFADGAVRRIRPDIKPDVFRALLTPAGGEVIRLVKDVEFAGGL
jgi:hypothetical protein